jgi:hypothetical protein
MTVQEIMALPQIEFNYLQTAIQEYKSRQLVASEYSGNGALPDFNYDTEGQKWVADRFKELKRDRTQSKSEEFV